MDDTDRGAREVDLITNHPRRQEDSTNHPRVLKQVQGRTPTHRVTNENHRNPRARHHELVQDYPSVLDRRHHGVVPAPDTITHQDHLNTIGQPPVERTSEKEGPEVGEVPRTRPGQAISSATMEDHGDSRRDSATADTTSRQDQRTTRKDHTSCSYQHHRRLERWRRSPPEWYQHTTAHSRDMDEKTNDWARTRSGMSILGLCLVVALTLDAVTGGTLLLSLPLVSQVSLGLVGALSVHHLRDLTRGQTKQTPIVT